MGLPSFITISPFSSMKFSIVLPLVSSVSLPHRGLYALKSPTNMYGTGNWETNVWRSSRDKGVDLEEYRLHIVNVELMVTLTATAVRFVLRDIFS